MLDFVSGQFKIMMDLYEKEGNLKGSTTNAQLLRIEKYANFLKQLLKLWMFVPCDEEGNVLKEPNYYSCFLDNSYLTRPQLINYENCVRYQKAKDRVLFEGWSLLDSEHITNGSYDIDILTWTFYRTNEGGGVGYEIIDDLTNYQLELTSTAEKEIGL